jgi:hypothetical protein
LKGEKLEDPEDALVIWVGQMNVKNKTATVEVINEQAKVSDQQMSVTNFAQKKRKKL